MILLNEFFYREMYENSANVWLCISALAMGLCVAMIAFIRLSSLKASVLLLFGLLVYDVFWVSYYELLQIGACLCTKTSVFIFSVIRWHYILFLYFYISGVFLRIYLQRECDGESCDTTCLQPCEWWSVLQGFFSVKDLSAIMFSLVKAR